MKKILILTLLVLLIFLGGCVLKKTSPENKPTKNILPIACTQEAKICPDGSAVGRTGSNCEFAPCPDGANKQDDIKPVDCPVGQKFFDEKCSCPSPWNIKTGSVDNGFQCVGMPEDSRR